MGEMGLHAKVKLSWKRRCKAGSWKNINICMIKILYMHGILIPLINKRKFILAYFRVTLKGENNKRGLSSSAFQNFFFFPLLSPLFLSLYFLYFFLKAIHTTSTWRKRKILLFIMRDDEIPCLVPKNKNRTG